MPSLQPVGSSGKGVIDAGMQASEKNGFDYTTKYNKYTQIHAPAASQFKGKERG